MLVLVAYGVGLVVTVAGVAALQTSSNLDKSDNNSMPFDRSWIGYELIVAGGLVQLGALIWWAVA